MHFHPYFRRVYSKAKVGIKMHALSLCFVSAACFSAFYLMLQSLLLMKNSKFSQHLFVYFSIMQLYQYSTIQRDYGG